MRKTFTRLAIASTMTLGSAGVVAALGTFQANATGPAGTTCQGANGFIAAGTVTDGPNPSVPPAPPGANCAGFVEVGNGGWIGGDGVKWSVTTSIFVAKDSNGMACGFTTTAPFTASGQGPASGGVGCLAPGASVTVTAS